MKTGIDAHVDNFDAETLRHIRRHRRMAARRSATEFESMTNIAYRVILKLARRSVRRGTWPPDDWPPATPCAA